MHRGHRCRDNTRTIHTNSDQGVPIYWLGGNKVADDYADFYDGDWDEEANDRDESGANGPDTFQSANYPFTGCDHDGTEAFAGGASRALGASDIRIGRPNTTTAGWGPISGGSSYINSDTRPFYALSEVLRAMPTVTISADQTSAVLREDDIVYTLTRSGSTTAALPVTVALTQTKDLLAADLTQTVTIPVGQSTESFTVAASSFQGFAAGTKVEGGTLTAAVQDDTGYDLGTPSSVDVAIVIGAMVRIEQVSYSVGEADGSLTVKLIARTGAGAPQPASNTSILLFSQTDGTATEADDDYTPNSMPYQFQPSDFSLTGGVWQAEKTIDIAVTNDALDEDDESFILKLEYQTGNITPLVDASGNSCGTECTVTVTITDDDTAGGTVSQTTLSVMEEDATGNSYTVVLNSEPTANVTVTVAGHSSTDLTLMPSSGTLTFTPMNWKVAQAVVVRAGDDADTTDDTVSLTHSAASTDTKYSGIAIAGVMVTVNDNDTAQVMGVRLTPGDAQMVVEWTAVDNATGYKVQWKSGAQDFNTGDRQYTVTSGSITSHTIHNLTNGTEYTVRVIATRTGANDGPPSEEVKGTPEAPIVAGVTVSTTALTVTERDATGGSYTVVLESQPTADVTVTVAGHAGTDLTLTPDPATLTFTSLNWETAQTVTVTAGGDTDTTDDTVTLTHSAASTDTNYEGIAVVSVTVTVNDNDTARVMGVRVTPGDTQLVVRWRAVGNATGYKVQWKSGDEDYNTTDRQFMVTSGSTTRHTISDLTNGTEYAVQVISTRTGAGDGRPSAEVTGTPTPETKVSAGWSLKPAGLSIGQKFRLLFLSSMKRDGSSSDISDYNTFVQIHAAFGHDDIRTYSSGFTAVGCTEETDAPDNTGTTYTSTYKGVPIYWLGGNKVADDYEDFYDTDWDEEANDKNESGTNGPNTAQEANYPFTGCDHDGTEAFAVGGSLALGSAGDVRVGRPNGLGGPISGSFFTSRSSDRPFYGLSEVFQVISDDATLSGLELKNDGGAAITLTPAFVPVTTNYTAPVVNRVDEITIIPTVNDGDATYEIQDGNGTALVDVDENEDDFQVALSEGENTINVVVTAPDLTTTQTYAVVLTRAMPAVSGRWSLTPDGLVAGDRFRLLFLSSTKRDATSSDISDYNTFIQNLAAAGHADIRAYSGGFSVVGCTTSTDARDNTGTTYTSTDKGVPIYWLGGAEVAADYEDFYDGSWDDEVNIKDEFGDPGPDTTVTENHVWTGCDDNGTEAFAAGESRAIGSGTVAVRVGVPNFGVGNGPIGSIFAATPENDRPLFGLSEVFQVPFDDATLSGLELEDDAGAAITLTPMFASETTNYTASVMKGVDEVTIIATVNDGDATYEIKDVDGTALVDADLNEDDFQVALSEGVNVIKVEVTSQNTTIKLTYTVVVTPPPTKVLPNWDLKPGNLDVGDKFRLLFLSSMKRDGTSNEMAVYNQTYPGPRRGRPRRHPGIQLGFQGGRLYRDHRRP